MGENANLNLGQRYWYIALKEKSYTCTDAKSILGHVLVLGLTVMNSSFLLLYFFNLFFSFSLSFCSSFLFCPPFFLSFFVLYTMVLHHFLHPRVGQVLGVLFSCFPCLFLNLPFLAVRLLVHCSGITSTLMRQES